MTSFKNALFFGKGAVDETLYPYLHGGLRNPFAGLKALRNPSEMTTSRILLKGLVWLRMAKVRTAYVSAGHLYAEVQGSSGGYVTCAFATPDLGSEKRIVYVPNAS